MTTFWQVLVSLRAHLAHMPSPEMVTFLSSSALSIVSPENITPAAASTNSFRIVGLPIWVSDLEQSTQTARSGAVTAPVEELLNHAREAITTFFLRNAGIRPATVVRGPANHKIGAMPTNF